MTALIDEKYGERFAGGDDKDGAPAAKETVNESQPAPEKVESPYRRWMPTQL